MDSYVHLYAQKAAPWSIATGISTIKMHYSEHMVNLIPGRFIVRTIVLVSDELKRRN